MSRMDEEDRRGYRGRRSRSESDNWDEAEDALFDRFNEEDRRGRSARTGRFVHRAEMEDPRDFWPLTPIGYPFGMARKDGEESRMGFLGDGRSVQVPYGHLADPAKDISPEGMTGTTTSHPKPAVKPAPTAN